MSFTKKNLVLFSFILFAFTACNLNFLAHKNGQLFFDFSSFAPEKNSNSRSAIEDYVEDGKDYFIDLTIDGSYKFSATIDLKDVNTYTIDNIPVGTRIKAKIDFYTYNIPGDLYSKETLLSGESKYYTITAGVNEIVINLKSEFVKLYVRYNQDYQNNDFENEDPDNNGKTPSTGFYYIQSAINWIAENGKTKYDYKIILTGYDSDQSFDQGIIFGNINYNEDNLRGKAKSITVTSTNPQIIAFNSSSIQSIIVRTSIPIYFEDINISTLASAESSTHSLILETTYGIDCNVTLGKGTIFQSDNNHKSANGSAIYMNGGIVKMVNNAKILNFSSKYEGGAVYVKYGNFLMTENSLIEGCTGTKGGAIYLETTHTSFDLSDNSKIKSCTASSYGGAICQAAGDIKIHSGFITECSANYSGGAIYSMSGVYSTTVHIKGGEIKNNEASAGSAIYLTNGSSYPPELILSDNACVDLSNDIFSEGQSIYLSNVLKTPDKVAIISYNNLSENKIVLNNKEDSQAVNKSYSKFFVRDVNGTVTNHYYIDENGKTAIFSDIITSSASPMPEVQLGDIVFADNSRIRATDFDKIDYKLYSSIAGIVFYVGTDDGLIGNVNLIVGTETYEDYFETEGYSTSYVNVFDETDITNFPGYQNNYDYNESLDVSSISKDKIIGIKTGNGGINTAITTNNNHNVNNSSFVLSLNSILQNDSHFPLYKSIISYGNKFSENSIYKLNTNDITQNWYIPTITEYVLFSYALENETFLSIYNTIGNQDLSGEYMSETILHKDSYSYPNTYTSYYQNSTINYPYNFVIDFNSNTITCAKTPKWNYITYKAFPIHIYTPGD